MRAAFLALLVINLGYLAWSQWLAAPVGSATSPPRADVPQLLLSSEPGAVAAAANAAAALEAQRAAGAATAVVANAEVANAEVAASMVAASTVAASAVACLSVGPYDSADAAEAVARRIAAQRSVEVQQRSDRGQVADGFMVVIRGLRSTADQERVQKRLRRGGLQDAFAVPRLPDGLAVSAGLFSERVRAERRSAVVRNMGLEPDIVQRQRPGAVYWLDVTAAGTGPETQRASLGDDLARLAVEPDGSRASEIVPCPQLNR